MVITGTTAICGCEEKSRQMQSPRVTVLLCRSTVLEVTVCDHCRKDLANPWFALANHDQTQGMVSLQAVSLCIYIYCGILLRVRLAVASNDYIDGNYVTTSCVRE